MKRQWPAGGRAANPAGGATLACTAQRSQLFQAFLNHQEDVVSLLDDQQIRSHLDDLEGWTREGDAIRKTYTLDSFPEAIAFVNRIAELAQGADHHPDIDIRYDRVSCALSTHSEGGLTRKDFDLARQLDAAR